MTKSTTDHVHYDATDSEVRCRHCEDRTALSDGSTAELLVMRLRGFLLMHKLCQPKAVPSPQMTLPHTGLAFIDAPGFPDEDDRSPPINPIAAEQGREMALEDGKVATCWADLWPQLEEALAPHEYAACKEHTPFVEAFDSVEWVEMAEWAARWVSDKPGPFPRPKALGDAVYAAVVEAQKRHTVAAKASEPKPRKKRTRKTAPAMER